jgi:S1-C subfamily serine protease
MQTTLGGALAALSNDIAATIEAVAANVVAVEGRDRVGSSGFYLTPNTIVTADHALETNEVEVVFADGRTERAQVAGRDAATDIALLTVASAGPPALAALAGTDLRVGAIAIAVARDDDGDLSATMGVVGSVGAAWRTWRGGEIDRFVRADLSLYPRFSGSPLVDASGRLVGMNKWGLSRRQSIVVPAATIARVVEALGTHGHIARGYLGLAMQGIDLPEAFGGGSGVIVLGVAPEGPAQAAGFIVGDIITALGARRIGDSDDIQAVLDAASVGTQTGAAILRGGKPVDLHVTIGERPHADDD